MTQKIAINVSSLVCLPELQVREHLHTERVQQYTEAMIDGDKFPAITVYEVDGKNLVAEGFHRVAAAKAAGKKTIDALLVSGTMQDAQWCAAAANIEHDSAGLYRSNEDKRRAVKLAIEARPKAADREIARQVGVGHPMVARVKESIWNNVPDTREVTRGGKTYEMQTGNIGKPGNDKEEPRPLLDDGEAEEYDLDQAWEDGTVTSDEIADLEYSFEDSKGHYDRHYEASAKVDPVADEVKQARPTFNQTNELVDWARWTWNPVTGCKHNCGYCYARDIANRFYPEKFEPTYRPERLTAPADTKLPKAASDETDPILQTAWQNVFVCSMADLFGQWVPIEWIEAVFQSCRDNPQWNYLFLTKFPQRYTKLVFPPTSWVGTTVDEQSRVANAEKAFAKIKAPVKWLSVEPMLEPLKFKNLSVFDWVVIGGKSRNSTEEAFEPDPWWVIDLATAARDAGCKVYFKQNVSVERAGLMLQEYPAVMTCQH